MAPDFIFNGQRYASRDDMPTEVRQQYDHVMELFADADKNGIPDILERSGSPTILVDGQEYRNLAEMPSDKRLVYDRAMHHFRSTSAGTWHQEPSRDSRIEINAVHHVLSSKASLFGGPLTTQSLGSPAAQASALPRGVVVFLVALSIVALIGILVTLVFALIR